MKKNNNVYNSFVNLIIMKKCLYLALAAITFAACTNDADYSLSGQGNPENAIGFQVMGRNTITRATSLNQAGHYNFGVFAYKSTDEVNNVMDNYLVGYMDAVNKKGYYMTLDAQTTEGDQDGVLNGQSRWAYEMLGNKEYDYLGTDGYYTKDQTYFMSNVEKQYLRYWDKSADYTNFYAYAPYVYNTDASKQVTYNNGSQVMTFPAGSIVAGYDDPSQYEYMYSASQVSSADYGKDVALNFKRINAKVRIKFWEDINGYSVRILDLSSAYNGVYAAPSKRSGTQGSYTYTKGKYVQSMGATVNFSAGTVGSNSKPISDNPTVTLNTPSAYNDVAADMLQFKAPADAAIGTTRPLASASPTVYYAIPKDVNTGAEYDCGFTFHVTYELTSNTGERIVVKDATVHVPANYCNWKSNTSYTYVFRITKNSNGTTGDPGTIDPTDPVQKTEDAFYPIVFDNCTIADYEQNDSEWNITDDASMTLYSVVLGTTSVNSNSGASVAVTLKKKDGTVISSPAGTWSVTGPTGANALTVTNGSISVPTNQATGEYTVTYDLSDAEKTQYPNQPKTYTAKFEVVQNYSLNLSTTEIGTGGVAATTLTITTADKFGGTTPKIADLSIEYPAGLTSDQKSKVDFTSVGTPTTISVAPDAVPGTYTIKYGDGSTTAATASATLIVKNFGFKLSSAEVGLSQSSQDVTISLNDATAVPTSSTYSVFPTDGNVTIDASSGKITVATNATPKVYTVTRTVTCGSSTTEYKRTLEVKNAYVLSLSRTIIDNDDTDKTITVTATKNGADATSNVEITPSVTGLSYSGGTITITDQTPAGTYTVSLKDGSEVVKTVTFIVQE